MLGLGREENDMWKRKSKEEKGPKLRLEFWIRVSEATKDNKVFLIYFFFKKN